MNTETESIFLQLPEPLRLHTYSFLTDQELASVGLACKQINKDLSSASFWSARITQKYQFAMSDILKNNPKLNYIEMTSALKLAVIQAEKNANRIAPKDWNILFSKYLEIFIVLLQNAHLLNLTTLENLAIYSSFHSEYVLSIVTNDNDKITLLREDYLKIFGGPAKLLSFDMYKAERLKLLRCFNLITELSLSSSAMLRNVVLLQPAWSNCVFPLNKIYVKTQSLLGAVLNRGHIKSLLGLLKITTTPLHKRTMSSVISLTGQQDGEADLYFFKTGPLQQLNSPYCCYKISIESVSLLKNWLKCLEVIMDNPKNYSGDEVQNFIQCLQDLNIGKNFPLEFEQLKKFFSQNYSNEPSYKRQRVM